MVFYEVDEALRALVRTQALDSADVEVVFDAPTKDWAARRNAPTVNLYLYDIREDLRRRERGLINSYDDQGVVVSRRSPPRHFKVTYLITAWTQRPEDEHRLLSALLYCFLRNETIPTELLSGRLAELGLPVPMTIALPPPEDRAFADVWSALGGELKPSLDLVVTAPVDGSRPVPAGQRVDEPLFLGLHDRTAERTDRPRQGRHPDAVRTNGRGPSPASDEPPVADGSAGDDPATGPRSPRRRRR
jgi:hypothetical protein